jgi:predicted transport protein
MILNNKIKNLNNKLMILNSIYPAHKKNINFNPILIKNKLKKLIKNMPCHKHKNKKLPLN